MNEPAIKGSERDAAKAHSRRAILVLLGSTLAVAFNIVTIFNGTLTVFIGPIAAENGWSRGEISLGLSVGMLALLLLNPLVGRLADRVGPSRVIVAGAPILALAMAALGWLPPIYPLFLLGCAMVGAAGALTFSTLYYMLMTRWFDRRLGLALGISASGIGIGFIVTPVAAQALIAEVGWRWAYAALGAGSATIVLLASAFLIRDHRPAPAATGVGEQGLADGPRSSLFWRLAIIYLLTGLAVNGTIIHLMPFLTDRGLSASAAAMLASSLGIGVLLARLGAGLLLDHVDTGLLGALCFVIGAMGIALLAFGPSGTLLAAVLLIGIALGAEGDVLAYMTRRVFGGAGYGRNISLMTSAFLLGSLTGPPLNGLLYDRLGSYTAGFSVFVGFMLVAAVLHAGVTRNREPRVGAPMRGVGAVH